MTTETATGKGGEINLNAHTISLSDKSIATAETHGTGEGGTIQVETSALHITGGSQLTTKATNIGNAGTLLINTTQPRDLTIDIEKGSVNASTSGASKGSAATQQAKGGHIQIGTSEKTLTILGDGTITAQTKGVGDGGDINLNGSSINLNQATATAQTSGSGKGGTITVNADSLTLDQGAQLNTMTTETATGKGGNINLNAHTISLSNKAIEIGRAHV